MFVAHMRGALCLTPSTIIRIKELCRTELPAWAHYRLKLHVNMLVFPEHLHRVLEHRVLPLLLLAFGAEIWLLDQLWKGRFATGELAAARGREHQFGMLLVELSLVELEKLPGLPDLSLEVQVALGELAVVGVS